MVYKSTKLGVISWRCFIYTDFGLSMQAQIPKADILYISLLFTMVDSKILLLLITKYNEHFQFNNVNEIK